jgi:hypothetical protein
MTGTGANESFRTQQSARDAKAQLTGWVPASTPLADAVRTLQSHGFTCQAAQPSAGGIQAAMLCTLAPSPALPPAQRPTAPATPVHWFVTLNSKDGSTVSDMLVGRTPRDIGG